MTKFSSPSETSAPQPASEAKPGSPSPRDPGNLSGLQKMIFICEPDKIVLAGRAAMWLLERNHRQEAILSYGVGADEVDFFVSRNKSSITIRQGSS